MPVAKCLGVSVLRLVVVVTAVSLSLAAPAVAVEADYSYIPGACQSSFRCGDTVDVRYPFFLANATYAVVEGDTAYAKSYCGYPGMAIACEGGRATLKLGRDNYTVLDIDYGKNTVTVAEADALSAGDCPRVTHNVTVPPETWLNLSTTANDDLVFFFDCIFTAATPRPPPAILPPINCSSLPERHGVSYVMVQPDLSSQDEWPLACKEPVFVPVLRDRLLSADDDDYLSRLNSDGYGQLLKQGFQLIWDPSAGPCNMCEESSGQCSYNQVGEFIGCLCSDGRVRSPDCVVQLDGRDRSCRRVAAAAVALLAGAVGGLAAPARRRL